MNEEKSLLSIRIYQMRKEAKLTQEELALKLGLKGKSSIANYESGKITPSDDIKLKMCDFFDCSMDYLMGITNIKSFKNIVSNTLSDIGIEITHYIPEFTYVRNFNLSEIEMNFLLNELFILLQSDNSSEFDSGIVNRLNEANIDYSRIKYALFIIEGTARNLKKNKKALNTIRSKLKKHFNKLDENQYYMCPTYSKILPKQPNWEKENIEGRIPLNINLMNIKKPEEHFFFHMNDESMNKIIKNNAFALIHKQDNVENGEIAVVLLKDSNAILRKLTKQGDLVILEPQSTDETFKTQVYDKNISIQILGKYIGKIEINQ